MKKNKKINIKDLDGYIIYGNKVSAWDNTAHAFKDGNLCGKPSLADNFAKFQGGIINGCRPGLAISNLCNHSNIILDFLLSLQII